jgi:hypothetical protein
MDSIGNREHQEGDRCPLQGLQEKDESWPDVEDYTGVREHQGGYRCPSQGPQENDESWSDGEESVLYPDEPLQYLKILLSEGKFTLFKRTVTAWLGEWDSFDINCDIHGVPILVYICDISFLEDSICSHMQSV